MQYRDWTIQGNSRTVRSCRQLSQKFFRIERCPMIRAVLLIAAALAFLWWMGSVSKASPEAANLVVSSPTAIVNFPLVCMDKTELLRVIGKAGGYPIWHGIRKETFLTTLYLASGGGWILTEWRAMSKTACILSSGEQNELLGIGGI
jgi:hypothetical protein